MLSSRKWDSFKRKTGKKLNYFWGAKKIRKKNQAIAGLELYNRTRKNS